MGESRTAIVLERAKHWIGIDPVAHRSQKAVSIITAEIVAVRSDEATNIAARRAGFQDRVANLKLDAGEDIVTAIIADRAMRDAATARDTATGVAGDGAILNGQGPTANYATTIVASTVTV